MDWDSHEYSAEHDTGGGKFSRDNAVTTPLAKEILDNSFRKGKELAMKVQALELKVRNLQQTLDEIPPAWPRRGR